MRIKLVTLVLSLICTMQSFAQKAKAPDAVAEKHKVRLSRIVVDSTQLEAYNVFLKEEIEASMQLEPGVLTLYATAEKKISQ